MKGEKKLRLTVIEVKSFVTALDREEIERVDAGADTDDTNEHCARSSDRVWACRYSDPPCNTNQTCPMGGCVHTLPGDDCGPRTIPM